MNYDKAVSEMLNVDGALAAAVVDFASGMMLAGGGSPAIDLENCRCRQYRSGQLRNENHENAGCNRCHRRHPDYIGQTVSPDPPAAKTRRPVPVLRIGQIQIQPGFGPPLFG